MGDAQIVNSATQDAASDYVLPPSVELILKAVSAEFRDNGAGADWLPAVVITSDSGHTVAIAADQAVKVTAGDDADVSWFRGVKHAGSGAAAALDLPWAYGEADLRTNATHAAYFQTAVSDATIFGYDSVNKRWHIDAEGVYLIFSRANFSDIPATTPAATRFSLVTTFTNPGGGNPVGGALDDPLRAGTLDLTGANALWNLNEMSVVSVALAQTPLRFYVTAANSAGSNVLMGLNTLIVRTSTVALLNPF